MSPVQRPLPSFCYSPAKLSPAGLVVHYFSAIHAAPTYAYDPDTCYDLLVDLNSPGEERGLVMEPKPGARYYASYHEFIDRDGRTYQLMPYDRVAYHAGRSELNGHTNLNRWTYGVALLASDESGFTDDQYAALALTTAQKMSADGFGLNTVAGHDQVATPRGRKQDPGPRFDWSRLRRALEHVV